MFLVPESPRWLARSGRSGDARRILARVGGDAYAGAAMRSIESSLTSEQGRKLQFSDLLHPSLRKALVLGITLAVFQQWCGINVIFNYAEEIFEAAGYDISSVLKNIAWTGSVNLAFTFLALGVVDRGGRRPAGAARARGGFGAQQEQRKPDESERQLGACADRHPQHSLRDGSA